MTAPKTKYPISSFGPELMAFLVKSGREQVILKFEGPRGKAAANTFRRRIHTLRQRMRQENHSDYPIAARAKVSIFWGEDAIPFGAPQEWKEDFRGHRGAYVVGRPHDTEFLSVLQEAGVTVDRPPLSDPAPKPVEDPGPPRPSILDDIYDEVKK